MDPECGLSHFRLSSLWGKNWATVPQKTFSVIIFFGLGVYWRWEKSGFWERRAFERKTDPDFAACFLHGFSSIPGACPVVKKMTSVFTRLNPGGYLFRSNGQKMAENRVNFKNGHRYFIKKTVNHWTLQRWLTLLDLASAILNHS